MYNAISGILDCEIYVQRTTVEDFKSEFDFCVSLEILMETILLVWLYCDEMAEGYLKGRDCGKSHKQNRLRNAHCKIDWISVWFK